MDYREMQSSPVRSWYPVLVAGHAELCTGDQGLLDPQGSRHNRSCLVPVPRSHLRVGREESTVDALAALAAMRQRMAAFVDATLIRLKLIGWDRMGGEGQLIGQPISQ
jgi:hypothetical protein